MNVNCYLLMASVFVALQGHLFKLLASKHTETSVWHATPFTSVFLETSIWSLRTIQIKKIKR